MGRVEIGGREVVIQEPTIAKVEEIGKKLSRVGKDAPELQTRLAKFTRDYERDNYLEMDRMQAKVQVPHRIEKLSESDWKQLGQKIKLPQSPTGTEQLLAMLPYVFDTAREQALEVVALLMVDDELMDQPNEVDKAVEENVRTLRFKAKPSQLIKLLNECRAIVDEVMEHQKEELGNLRAFVQRITQDDSTEDGKQATREAEHEAALAEMRETLGVSGDSASSTDSQPDTAGDTERSSIDSPAETFSPSPS
jgi:hypothetical protein